MPGVSKRLQELVSSLDGELTAMAAGPKHTVEVFCTDKATWYKRLGTNHQHFIFFLHCSESS